MAKPRHDEQPTSSNTTLAILVAGGVLVAALVVWALTRTVEPASTADTTSFPAVATPVTDTGFAMDTASVPSTATFANTATTAPAAQPRGDQAEVTRIAAEDLRAKLNRGEVTVVDVRDAAAFTREHIPGALNMPFASLEAQIDTLPKGKAIVTYCT